MVFFRFIVVILIVLVLGLGLLDYLTNFEENQCEMTYMFAQPQYLRVPLDAEIQNKFPRYGLYLYGEGQYADTVRRSNFRLSGVPVLFIPGNAGSYRQVRSLGSVALRKAEDAKTKFHFNYFSLDFDEELSGLYGQALYDETEFTHACVKKILSLYRGAPSKPKSVILVGHSMGGMVARSLFMQPDFKPELVNTIITQATPHQAPAVSIDPVLVQFYDELNTFWKEKENTTVSDVTLLSTGGGYRDILVRSQLTSLNMIARKDRSLSSNTMSVPGAWVSTDHLCHVWCKQIVLATQRSLFDIIDQSTKQVAVSPFYRLAVFLHHFFKNPGSKKFKGGYDTTVTLEKSVKWEIRKKLSWKLWADGLPKLRYSVTEIPPLLVPPEYATPEYGYLAISNINNQKWVGMCSVREKIVPSSVPGGAKKKTDPPKQCSQITNHAQYADQLPPAYSDRKVVHISPEDVKDNTHVVAVLPKTKKRVEFYSELYKLSERHLVYNTTDLLTFMKNFPDSLLGFDVVINKTVPGALFYNISLHGLDIPLQAYTAHLTVLACTEMPPAFPGALLKLYIPWAYEHTYSFVRSDKNGSIDIKLMTPRPASVTTQAQLHLYLLPTCTYSLSITLAWRQLFGQFVRFYGAHIIGFLVIQVLMVLSWQMKTLDEQGEAPSFTVSHGRWAQPWRIVPLATFVRFMLYFPEEDNMAKKLGIPDDDRMHMESLGIWYAALPVLYYLAAYAIMMLYAIVIDVVLCSLGRIFGFIFRWFQGNNICCKLVQKSHYAMFVTGFLMSQFVCGALGIVIVYATTIVKTISLYVAARQVSNQPAAKWSSYNVHTSFIMLLLLAFTLNVPSLLAWEKNIKYSIHLSIDPSRITGAVVSITAIVLSLVKFPRYTGEMYGIASALLYMICVAMMMFTMTSIYRIPTYIYSALIVIATAAVLSFLAERPVEQSAPKQEKTKAD